MRRKISATCLPSRSCTVVTIDLLVSYDPAVRRKRVETEIIFA